MNMFTEVWQYGSNEAPVERGGDHLYEQDGIAPQTPVPGITKLPTGKGGRAYIPLNGSKGFIISHQIANYGWIFEITSPANKTQNRNGYVTPR